MLWRKGGHSIQDTERFTFNQSGNDASFTIPAALSTDSGDYTVTAKDDRGETNWTFSLVVRIEDVLPGDVDVQRLISNVQVSVEHTSKHSGAHCSTFIFFNISNST